MASFMEMIFIDSDGDARQTDMRRALETDAGTWAAFRRYKRYSVDLKEAMFLLDYYNRSGDLADTIAIDAAGFTAITGHHPKDDSAYRQIDRDFWKEVRKLAGHGVTTRTNSNRCAHQ